MLQPCSGRDRQREEDATIIEAITEAIRTDNDRQTAIVDYCREHHQIGRRSTEAVLRRYSKPGNQIWKRQPAFKDNALIYELVT